MARAAFCDNDVFAHVRDNEQAIVQVNGNTCWSRTLRASQGKQICGKGHNNWNEDKIKVQCTAPAVNGKFTVRVYTTLNSGAQDESFGIDNVVLKRVGDDSGSGSGSSDGMTANFDNGDQQGWSCDSITSCGEFGNICGGFNTKAKSHDIKKTFSVPAGQYSLTLDFIKIDSWFVCWCDVVGCVVCEVMVLWFGVESHEWPAQHFVITMCLHTSGTTSKRSCK